MNARERMLLILLLVLVGGFAVVYGGARMFYQPYRDLRDKLVSAEDDVARKENELRIFRIEQANQGRWNKLSLPESSDLASAQYAKILKPLLRDAGLTVDDFKGPSPQESRVTAGIQKKSRHVTLPFQVRAKGTVASLVAALDALQRVPVMHRVKSMTIDRADTKDRTGKITVQMTIEAMIVNGSKNQPTYQPSPPSMLYSGEVVATRFGFPGGLLMAPYVLAMMPAPKTATTTSERNFHDIALRNPLVGHLPPPPPPPAVAKDPPEPEPEGPDLTQYIKIDTIVPTAKEAFLRNYLIKSAPMRIRSTPMSGYDVFRIMDEEHAKVLVRGKVLRIDPRDIYFQVGSKVYAFHFGQTLAEALARPLSEFALDNLDLTNLIDAEFAKEDDGNSKKKTKGRK